MPAVSQTGSDTANINGTIITTMVDGMPFDITFPNSISAVKRGKEGNVITAKNEMGNIAQVKLRILLGGIDDKNLNALLQQWDSDPSSFKYLTGQFVKHVGDGQGNVQNKVYQLTAGYFDKRVEMRTSAEGDTEQSVAEYTLIFGGTQVSIQ